MIADMSKREKVLAGVVLVTLFILLNVVRLKFFMTGSADLKLAQYKATESLKVYQMRDADRAMWEERGQWLDQNMQPMGDPDVAYKQLRDALMELGKKHTVNVDSPSQGTPNNQSPHYTSLSVGVQAKGSWKSIFDYIRELQAPGQFVVFESAKLEIDEKDKTQMKAELRVAKWYTPQPAR